MGSETALLRHLSQLREHDQQLQPRKAKTMSPRSSRKFSVGDFSISIISDGFIVLPKDIIMPEADNLEAAPILARMGGGVGSAPMHTNVPVISVGDDLIVVDTGSGVYFQDTAGALLSNLRAADIDPASITKVVFTHAHPDHMGGTTLPGTGDLAFPNAEYFAAEAEYQFWVDPEGEHLIADGLKPFVAGARRDFSAIESRLTLLTPGEEVTHGMSFVATPGHTAGHVSILLDGGKQLMITGDALTNPIISFEHPEWRFGFDADHETAVDTRRKLLDRLVADQIGVLGYHWNSPGVGNVDRTSGGFKLVMSANE